MVIEIKNLQSNEVDRSAYWTYEELDTCLNSKLKALFFVYADSKIETGEEYFHYTKAEIYLKPSISKLLQIIYTGFNN